MAGRLFSQRGYYGTSIRDIAAAIRLQGGSLYAHIASKEELLWEIVDEAAQAFLSGLEPIARSADPPLEKLRQAVAAHLRVVTERQDAAVVFNHEWKALRPKRRAEILARRDAYEALFRGILQEGIRAGVFRADLNVPLITRFVLTALNGVAVWYRPEGPLSPEQIAEAFTDWVIRGIQAPAGAAGDSASPLGEGGADGDLSHPGPRDPGSGTGASASGGSGV